MVEIPDEPCSECGAPAERSLMDSVYDTVPLCENCMSNHLAEKTGRPTGVPTRDDPNWQDTIQAGNPMSMTWRLLKNADEVQCYTCGGRGSIVKPFTPWHEDEKPMTCPTCKGKGMIPLTHRGDEGEEQSAVRFQQIGEATMSGGRKSPILMNTRRDGTPTFAGQKMQGVFTRGNPMKIAWRMLKHDE